MALLASGARLSEFRQPFIHLTSDFCCPGNGSHGLLAELARVADEIVVVGFHAQKTRAWLACFIAERIFGKQWGR
ncbi:MAG: hypothetical protein ACLGJC_27930 [Alphaproteobacteria bacterium]